MSEKQWAGYARRADGPCVIVDLMECTAGVWRMDGSVAGYEAELPPGFGVEAGGKPVVYRRTEAYRKPAGKAVPSSERVADSEKAMDSEKAVGFESIEASEYIEDSGSAVDSEKVADSECGVGFEVIEDFGSAGDEDIESDLPAGAIEIVKRAGFSFELPVAELGARTEIRFFLKNGSREREALPVTSLEYQAKLTDALANAWWSFGGYMVTFLWRERTACGLAIERASRAARMRREAKLLKEIATAPYGSKQMALVRGLYWAAGPFYRKKNIWIMFDKLYKGGDCGEYFYKYVCGRQGGKCAEADAKSREYETTKAYRYGRNEMPGGKRQGYGTADVHGYAKAETSGRESQDYGVADAYGHGRNEMPGGWSRNYETADAYGCDRNEMPGRGSRGYGAADLRAGRRILPVYVVRGDVADFARLRREGYHPAAYRTLAQRLQYLYASVVFATHSGVPSFCGFNKWEVRFVQDRLRAVNTCIQHGLSVQDLTADSNRLVNNNRRYYCASQSEIENLSGPSYDYAPGVLRLTGIPRYDGLVDRARRQILIAPTWRSYLSMASVMGQERPYNPDFKSSDYFRIYADLLTDERLRRTAERTGYQILYLLHPVYQAQKADFAEVCEDDADKIGVVRIATPLEISYEQALTESALMVTDFSGVQFDFAYMRKPVVYFHPPELPPHYGEGGFSYERQGFGEICTRIDELVELLCGYMEAGCRLKPFYREREDSFFAYDDRENCRRIYEDALTLQEETARS